MAEYHENSDLKDQLLSKLDCYKHIPPSLDMTSDGKQPEEEDTFASLMKLFCEIEMTDEEAEYHFHRIVDHTGSLEEQLDRSTGILVGMLDYLLNINPRLDCPKFIEISKFQKLLAQSALDSLTGLYNRRYFDVQFTKELHRCQRYNTTFSLAMLDLDDFKYINDNYGHDVGDQVLEDFSFLLKNQLRSEDIAARYGGEEFVILFPHTEITGARIVIQRFLEEVGGHCFAAQELPDEYTVTFSAGVANFPLHADTRKELLKIADRGMYLAKQQGKNQVAVFPAERRDSKRYQTDAGLLFTAGQRREYVARMKNVSLTGLAAETHADLSPGEVIRLQFTLEEETEYDIQAQIVWVNKSSSQKGLHFGARYEHDDYNFIRKVISPYLDKQKEEEGDQPTLF